MFTLVSSSKAGLANSGGSKRPGVSDNVLPSRSSEMCCSGFEPDAIGAETVDETVEGIEAAETGREEVVRGRDTSTYNFLHTWINANTNGLISINNIDIRRDRHWFVEKYSILPKTNRARDAQGVALARTWRERSGTLFARYMHPH